METVVLQWWLKGAVVSQPSGSKQKVSIRKISEKINICLVAMQLLSVATPNKHLCEGVDSHPVNKQTKTCGCEANGYSTGCYEWCVIGVHTRSLAGCERGQQNCALKRARVNALRFLGICLASLISAGLKAIFWKKLVPIQRNFINSHGESLQSDSFALGEVSTQAKQASRRGDWWGTRRNSTHCGVKATRKTVIKVTLIKWKLLFLEGKDSVF